MTFPILIVACLNSPLGTSFLLFFLFNFEIFFIVLAKEIRIYSLEKPKFPKISECFLSPPPTKKNAVRNDAITAMRPAYLVLINRGLLKAWVLDF
jgi:hypothetical protein